MSNEQLIETLDRIIKHLSRDTELDRGCGIFDENSLIKETDINRLELLKTRIKGGKV